MSSMKNLPKLELLFNLIVNKSKAERKKNPDDFDGLGYWRNIKGLIPDNISASKWRKISSKLTNEIMNFPEEQTLGNGKKEIIENNHFIIQQVRIPHTEKPSLRKILQVGLNVGQWLGNPNPKIYKQVNYNQTELHLLSKYLDKKDIRNISEKIDDELMKKLIIAIKK